MASIFSRRDISKFLRFRRSLINRESRELTRMILWWSRLLFLTGLQDFADQQDLEKKEFHPVDPPPSCNPVQSLFASIRVIRG